MAACDSLSSLFKKPLPENPTLIESLSSWSQIMPQKPLDPSAFTELFGELHFKEKPVDPPQLSAQHSEQDRTSLFDVAGIKGRDPSSSGCKLASMDSLLGTSKNLQYSCDISLKNCDPLQLCTEGLGSESSDDVDDLINEEAERLDIAAWKERTEAERINVDSFNGYSSRSFSSDVRLRTGAFPPPIPSLGRTGKPCICFKSYRENGRFVLREIRIPTQEFLHASREDGRLKLHLVHTRDDDIPEGDETQEEDQDEDNEVTEKDNEA